VTRTGLINSFGKGTAFSRAAKAQETCGLYSLLKNSILGGAALQALR
jgi:hypothetical protein